jgi:hypothetical protein
MKFNAQEMTMKPTNMLISAPFMAAAFVLGFIGCASHDLPSRQAFEKLRPIAAVPMNTSAPNLFVQINNAAPAKKDVLQNVKLFINGREILPEGGARYSAEAVFYQLQLAPGVYKVKAVYRFKTFWKEKEYNFSTPDGKVRIYPDQRTVLAIALDCKPNGDLRNLKTYFRETAEALSAPLPARDEIAAPSQERPQAEKITASQDGGVFDISFVNENKRRRRTREKIEERIEPQWAAPSNPSLPAAGSSGPETTIPLSTSTPARGNTIALQINTEPIHCEIIVNDQYAGQSPLIVHVDRSRSHVIQIFKTGYADKMKLVDHRDFGGKTIHFLIEKLQAIKPDDGMIAPADQHSAEVPLAWFALQLKLVKESPGFSPPVASRAFGYAGVALYEAVVPGMPAYRSLAGQLNGLSELPQVALGQRLHWPAAANSALAAITRLLFANASSENKAAIAALELRFANQFRPLLQPEIFQRSVTQGKSVAEAIYIWSLSDGGHEGYLKNLPYSYKTPVGPRLWVPTSPNFSRALQPYWGNNRPFVLNAGSECQPPPPPPYSEQPGTKFYNEMMEVYNAVNKLTAEQRAIAEFWADNPGETATPPGHSISILNQIIKQKQIDLEVAAEAYAKVGMAVADAFIACWRIKYQYNLLRPITCIQSLMDPDWNPIMNTPPFPEFTSGHSVQSGATAQVLTDLFGAVAFTDHTHDNRGLAPRSFSSFFAAADEAAISRLYGGIHFRSAIELGLEQGKCVGQKVGALKFKK